MTTTTTTNGVKKGRKKRHFGTLKIMKLGDEGGYTVVEDEEMPPLDTAGVAERWIRNNAQEGETYVLVRMVKRISVKTVTRQQLELETVEIDT